MAQGCLAQLHPSGTGFVNEDTSFKLIGGEIQSLDERPESDFNTQNFHDGLTTERLGRSFLTARNMVSTQKFMQDNRMLLPDGSVVLADQQEGGCGRGGNVWMSPPGCLMFSLLFYTNLQGERIPFVQHIVCVAVVSSLQRIFSERLGITANPSTFPVRIKWPNDIYVLQPAGQSPLKMGGILCHSTYIDSQFNVIVGVGLNVDNAEPSTCVNEVLRACAESRGMTVHDVTREELLSSFSNDFESLLEMLETGGFSRLQGTYERYWMHSDQQVQLQDPDDPTRLIPIIIKGLTASGYLRGADEYGTEFELHPDGNSLDMMQGLIKRKL